MIAITTSLQSPEPTIRLPSVDASDSVHIGTIAGVAGCVAVIAILVVLVLLVVLILWKRKKDKELRAYVMSTITCMLTLLNYHCPLLSLCSGHVHNPIYSIAEGLDDNLDG